MTRQDGCGEKAGGVGGVGRGGEDVVLAPGVSRVRRCPAERIGEAATA